MTKLTRQDLEHFAAQPDVDPSEWIRVQLDTGGIAAGAETAFSALAHARNERHLTFSLLRAGSIGY